MAGNHNKMTQFKEIPYDDNDVMENLIGETFLVAHKDWENADVMTLDDDGKTWYSPLDGSEVLPIPTHYMAIPQLIIDTDNII